MKDVEIRRSLYFAVQMRKSFRCEIQGCSFIGTASTVPGSGQAYCVQLDFTSSWNVIQNNISDGLLNMAILEYGPCGNVIAYNYATHSAYYDPTWMIADYSVHALHPGFNLFEGNIGDLFAADFIHGSGSHQTVFRNYWRGKKSGTTDHHRAIENDSWHRYYNLVGNMLGNTSWSGSDVYEAIGAGATSSSTAYIFRLGYKDAGTAGTTGHDATAVSSAIRHGNFDKVTSSIHWEASIADHGLPSSYFRATRPAYWGTAQAWPSIGSDLTPSIGSNPAERRFLGIAEGSTEGGGDPPPEDPPDPPATFELINVTVIR